MGTHTGGTDVGGRAGTLAYLKEHPEAFAAMAHVLEAGCADGLCPASLAEVEEYGDATRLSMSEDGLQLSSIIVDWGGLPMEVRAEGVRARVLALPPAEGLPSAMIEGATITNLVKIDACDGDDCTQSTTMDADAFAKWTAGVEEVPGWDVAELSACEDDCCTFQNLGRDAAKDGGMVPHELLELRAVCFEDGGAIRRIKWIQY